MSNSIYDHYLTNEIFSADPVKLVTILYRAAIDSIASAREHLRAGAIRERSRQISKAWRIVHELQHSLNHEQGAELSGSLAALYAYVQRRLLEANSTQTDVPLAEAHELLSTLLEGWVTLCATPKPAESTEPIESERVSCAI